MDIADIKDAKRAMERAIYNAIVAFETATGLSVTHVDTERVSRFGTAIKSETVAVTVRVEV